MAVPGWLLPALCALGQTAWPPPADAPPESFARPERMPDDPEYRPGPGCTGQHALWSFTPTCAVALDAVERAAGPGISVDRAWALELGLPAVRVAIVDTGVDWSDPELAGRWALNRAELPAPEPGGPPEDPHDADGDGAFTPLDFTDCAPGERPTPDRITDRRLRRRADRGDVNGNGLLDPDDLRRALGDGRDGDGNGRVDDVCGWDLEDDDADPSDPAGRGGHGPGLARRVAAEIDNGLGGAGVCPRCTVWPIRVGPVDRVPAPRLAAAVREASAAAPVILAALPPDRTGGPGVPALVAAIDETDRRGAVVVVSGGLEGGPHPRLAWDAERVIAVAGVGYDAADPAAATRAVAPDPCGTTGPHLSVAAPGRCDAAAPALVAGLLGLMVSADRRLGAGPPPSAAELRATLEATAVAPPFARTPDGAALSWTPRAGFGRVDARAAVEAVRRRAFAPQARLVAPAAESVLDPSLGRPSIVEGAVVAARGPATWRLELARGLAPPPEAFEPLTSGAVAAGETARVTAEVPIDDLFADPTAPAERPYAYALTVRLVASGADGAAEARRLFHVHRPRGGWPAFPVELGSAVAASPRVVDLDADGSDEILVGDTSGRLHRLEATGTESPGWPVRPLGDDTRRAIVGAPAVGRQPDGTWVIAVLGADARLAVLDEDGRPRGPFPLVVTASATVEHGPVLADLDGDGGLEVVVVTTDGRLRAFSTGGRPLPAAATELGERTGAPAVGDLDGDGRAEIVLATEDGLHVLGLGTPRRGAVAMTGFPVRGLSDGAEAAPGPPGRRSGPPRPPPPSPVIAELDGEDGPELVVVPFGGVPRIVGRDGRPSTASFGRSRDSFGRLHDARASGPEVVAGGAEPAVADLDRDGRADIVEAVAPLGHWIGGDPAALDAYEPLVGAWSGSSGRFVSGFPAAGGARSPSGFTIVDLDGDRRPEVLFADGDRLRARSSAGVSPRGFPRPTAGVVVGSAAVGDLDGDGRLDLVAVTESGRVWAWRVEIGADVDAPWPTARHDDRGTGDLRTPRRAALVDPRPESCACRSAGTATRGVGPGALLALLLLARPRRRPKP